MMCSLDGLFANNRAWANQRVADDPEFFTRLARQQASRWPMCAARPVYGLADGLLRRVGVSVSGGQSWVERYRVSLQTLVGQTERLRQTCTN